MPTNVYKPGILAITVGGFPGSGYADGEVAVLELNGEGVTMVVGTDGSVTFVLSADASGQLTINVKQDADFNRILGGMVAARSQVKVTISDNLGFNAFAKDCMVKKHPNWNYGKELSNRSWIILLPVVKNTYPDGTVPAS